MTAHPPLAPRPASIGRRVGAFAIDLGVMSGVAAVLAGLMTALVLGAAASGDVSVVVLAAAAGWAVMFLGLLTWWLVYSAMQGGRGSIGQRALGLRLHDATSAQLIGFWRAVLRNVVWGLAGSIVVGYFTPLFDSSPRRQGWHDLAARATVVDVRGARDAAASATHAVNPYLGAPGAPAPGPWPWGPAPIASSPAPVAPPAVSLAPSATPATMPVAIPAELPPAPLPPAPLPAAPAAYAPSAPAPAVAPAAARMVAPAPARVIAPAPAVAPAASPAAAFAPVLVPAAVVAQLDETRVPAAPGAGAVPPPAQRAALYPGAPVLAVLTWDDGTRMAVYGRTLYGRNPAGEPGAVTVAVRDETLSLSKTHFELGSDERGPWIVDRHSTNGTLLVRDGSRHPLVPGVRTMLRDADRLELGDRSTTVGIA